MCEITARNALQYKRVGENYSGGMIFWGTYPAKIITNYAVKLPKTHETFDCLMSLLSYIGTCLPPVLYYKNHRNQQNEVMTVLTIEKHLECSQQRLNAQWLSSRGNFRFAIFKKCGLLTSLLLLMYFYRSDDSLLLPSLHPPYFPLYLFA